MVEINFGSPSRPNDDAKNRATQLQAAKTLREDLLRNLFVYKVNAKPRIVRTDAKKATADVAIDWTAAYNPDTVRHLASFFTDLAKAGLGDEDASFKLLLPGAKQATEYRFRWYSEVKETLFDTDIGINAYWIPAFALVDAAGKTGAVVLHGVRCSSYDDDVIGDDATINLYDRGSFSDYMAMYRGSVWERQTRLKPEMRMAILRDVKLTDLDALTTVQVSLVALRVLANGDWNFVTF